MAMEIRQASAAAHKSLSPRLNLKDFASGLGIAVLLRYKLSASRVLYHAGAFRCRLARNVALIYIFMLDNSENMPHTIVVVVESTSSRAAGSHHKQ